MPLKDRKWKPAQRHKPTNAATPQPSQPPPSRPYPNTRSSARLGGTSTSDHKHGSWGGSKELGQQPPDQVHLDPSQPFRVLAGQLSVIAGGIDLGQVVGIIGAGTSGLVYSYR